MGISKKRLRWRIGMMATLALLKAVSSVLENQPARARAMEAASGCRVSAAVGSLSTTTVRNLYTYASSGGGYLVFRVNGVISVRHRDYVNFEIQLWGGDEYHTYNHENLNGKHIKDWLGDRRTIVFPDGAKVTMVVAGTGTSRKVVSMTIYEGTQVHRLNPSTGELESSRELTAAEVAALDNAEADGETSTFAITETGLIYYNLYFENVAGQKVESRYDLGSLTLGNDNQVNDFFDDPRIGHT